MSIKLLYVHSKNNAKHSKSPIKDISPHLVEGEVFGVLPIRGQFGRSLGEIFSPSCHTAVSSDL